MRTAEYVECNVLGQWEVVCCYFLPKYDFNVENRGSIFSSLMIVR